MRSEHPPQPFSRAFTLEMQNTHQHTDQVNEDKNKGSSRESGFSSVVVFYIRPCYWCCVWKWEDLNFNHFFSSQWWSDVMSPFSPEPCDSASPVLSVCPGPRLTCWWGNCPSIATYRRTSAAEGRNIQSETVGILESCGCLSGRQCPALTRSARWAAAAARTAVPW